VPFPGTLAKYSPNAGDTMAQLRSRWSCANDNCRALLPSVDVKFVDEWTDATTAGRAPDASFAYTYAGAGGIATPFPTTASCTTAWSSTCRITINYVAHIHPLWHLDRRIFDVANPAVLLANHTCDTCHSPKDAANVVQVPAGQLDLSDGDSQEEPLQKNAYRELLFPDNQQVIIGGALQDLLVTTIDPVTGLPVGNPVAVQASISAGSARASTRFFSRFVAGGSHAGYLSPAELRLISEWVDIGAQYFNNPFDPAVPLN